MNINKKISIALIILIVSILLKKFVQLNFLLYYDILCSVLWKSSFTESGLFTQDELSQFDGVKNQKLYLSFLGNIYDVSQGKKHYSSNSPYHYFVAKDGSRAFVTGDFTDESSNRDHIIDLSCDELSSLQTWNLTLGTKYSHVGSLIGRYYNSDGTETDYSNILKSKLQECINIRNKMKIKEKKYPPCNVSWSAEDGSQVWCSKNSGGVSRNWVGVPRQLYHQGDKKPSCVCVNIKEDYSTAMLQQYKNCESLSVSCYIED